MSQLMGLILQAPKPVGQDQDEPSVDQKPSTSARVRPLTTTMTIIVLQVTSHVPYTLRI